MTENPQSNRLQELLDQKVQLQHRTDLSPEEKDRLGKKLRREIRKLGGTVRVLSDPEAVYEHREVGSTSDRKSRAIPSGRSAKYQKREFQSYKEELLTELQDLGLEWKDPHDLLDIPAAGYSFVFMYELEVKASKIIENFKNQWAQQKPEWFAVIGEGSGEYMVMGPLPRGMVH